MNEYLRSYKNYPKKIVYQFRVGYGGIGDCIKYFMYLLHLCIQHKYRLCYQIMNIPLEKYIRLLHQSMYIREEEIKNPVPIHIHDFHLNQHEYTVCTPFDMYDVYTPVDYPVNNIFTFSQAIWYRKKEIFSLQEKYVSIHIRLGDKFLETDPHFVVVKNDERPFQEESLSHWIETHRNKPIVLFCDNHTYKTYLQEKFPYIHTTTGSVGHTSLCNTTEQHIIDAVTEFYILTQSESIVANCVSGFSDMAAKFNRIPISCIE
jgi:hypothetical protein